MLLYTYATQHPIGTRARSLHVGTPAHVYTVPVARLITAARVRSYTKVPFGFLLSYANFVRILSQNSKDLYAFQKGVSDSDSAGAFEGRCPGGVRKQYQNAFTEDLGMYLCNFRALQRVASYPRGSAGIPPSDFNIPGFPTGASHG